MMIGTTRYQYGHAIAVQGVPVGRVAGCSRPVGMCGSTLDRRVVLALSLPRTIPPSAQGSRCRWAMQVPPVPMGLTAISSGTDFSVPMVPDALRYKAGVPGGQRARRFPTPLRLLMRGIGYSYRCSGGGVPLGPIAAVRSVLGVLRLRLAIFLL